MATPEGRPGAAPRSASIPATAGTLAPATTREANITRHVQDVLSRILREPPDLGLEIARRLNLQLTILLRTQAQTPTTATKGPPSIINPPPPYPIPEEVRWLRTQPGHEHDFPSPPTQADIQMIRHMPGYFDDPAHRGPPRPLPKNIGNIGYTPPHFPGPDEI